MCYISSTRQKRVSNLKIKEILWLPHFQDIDQNVLLQFLRLPGLKSPRMPPEMLIEE